MKRLPTLSRVFSPAAVAGVKRKAIIAFQEFSPLASLQSEFRRDPFRNTIALAHHEQPPQYTEDEQSVQEACVNSARVVIEKNQLAILHQYFTEQSAVDSVMGRFYRTMTFDNFLLRLYQKRYRAIYLDGRVVVPRSSTDVLAKAKWKFNLTHFFHGANPFFHYRKLLLEIGTEADKNKIYEEYLTINELMLTPALLPQAISIMIGNGSRALDWPYIKEAERAADLAVLSSAVAPEFSDGRTLHLDFIFSVVIENPGEHFMARVNNIKKEDFLVHAARAIYGEKLAIDFTADEARKNKTGEFIHIKDLDVDMWLYKPAYLARVKMLLKTLLLSSDEAMKLANTGSVFNLKGMGLGAFGFSYASNQVMLENLFVEAVKEVLNENAGKLKHIRVVNLINLPTDWDNLMLDVKHMAEYHSVKLVRSIMSPTEKTLPQQSEEIGATHFCGDSASLVGNEGQIGLPRETSDDPATLYSMLDPTLLDPSRNKHLQSTECIVILDSDTNQLFPFKNSAYGQAPSVTPPLR
jgi:hypothetical protein